MENFLNFRHYLYGRYLTYMYLLFTEIVTFMILCRSILSVIARVIDKLDSGHAVVQFCQSLACLQTELDSARSYNH